MDRIVAVRVLHGARAAEWIPVLFGLLLLFVPTFVDLVELIWIRDDEFHGAVILAVVVWLIWDRRYVLLETCARTAPAAGLAILGVGLALYFVGRTLGILVFQVGALVPVLSGVLLAMRGTAALREYWFMLLFCVYLVPLPAYVQDAMTLPLKQEVSALAARLIYAAGYPIAHEGVVITVGQYQLLVADACAGLNSMFSLSAIGLLYLYLVRRSRWWHNAIVVLCLLPIAFLANLVRVITLALVTYHLGDAAGQGFMHGLSGILLFAIALATVILIDVLAICLLGAAS
jgi:exosortase B